MKKTKESKPKVTIASLTKELAEQTQRLEQYRAAAALHDVKILEWRDANNNLDAALKKARDEKAAALEDLRGTLGAFAEYALALSHPETAKDAVRLAELQRNIANYRLTRKEPDYFLPR